MVKELALQLNLTEEKTRECFIAFIKQLHFIVYKESYLPYTLLPLYSELGDDGLLNYWAMIENIIRKSEANDDFILDWSTKLQNMYSLDSINLREYFKKIKAEFDKEK